MQETNGQKLGKAIGGIMQELILIFIGVFAIVFKFLYRFRNWLWKFALTMLVIANLNAFFINYVDAPKAQAAMVEPRYNSVQAPTTQFEEIKDYIRQVFGKDAPNAFKILACENKKLDPLATGHNTDGTYDRGIFQINDVHKIPAQYVYDWHLNVDIAYHLFKEQGWTPWACESVWHALERNDTI